MGTKTLLTKAMFAKHGEAYAEVALPHTWNAFDGQDGGLLLGGDGHLPTVYEVEDDHDRHNGTGYRQHNAAHGAYIGTAVHVSGFDNLLRHGVLKVVAHDQQIGC